MKTCSITGCEDPARQRQMCWRHYSRMWKTGSTELTGRRYDGDPITRFHARYDVQPNGCWRWNAKSFTRGYGSFRVGDKFLRAHRWAYEHFIGPIPEGLVIDHTCHNADPDCAGGVDCLHRRCVRPDHLEAVPDRENLRRSSRYYGTKTHCIRGHEFTGANTIRNTSNARVCRICRDAKNKRMSLARAAASKTVQCEGTVIDRRCSQLTLHPSGFCRHHQPKETPR